MHLSLESLKRRAYPATIPIFSCFPGPSPPSCYLYYHEFLSQFGSVFHSLAFKNHKIPNAFPAPFFKRHIDRYNSPCTKLAKTLLPVCSNGCPTTICKNRCSPSLRCSITSSLNLLVKTFPGKGGIVTRADSRSRISRKYSKSE